jgi:hypothetical protein
MHFISLKEKGTRYPVMFNVNNILSVSSQGKGGSIVWLKSGGYSEVEETKKEIKVKLEIIYNDQWS